MAYSQTVNDLSDHGSEELLYTGHTLLGIVCRRAFQSAMRLKYNAVEHVDAA